MTSFKDDDKTKFNESFINLAFKNGLKRNENFKIPYMNKYHYHHDFNLFYSYLNKINIFLIDF